MAKKRSVSGMSRKQRAATMIAIKEQQASRSPRAVSMDARKTAKRTLEPETDDLHPWQRHPNRYDVHGVDSRTGTVLVNRWRCSILKDGKRVLTETSHFIKKDAQRIVDQTNKHYPEMKATLVCDAGPLKNWHPEFTPPEPEKVKFDPEKVPTEEEFYRREYWQDPKTGRHPASGSGRLQIHETAYLEVTTIGDETLIKMYNPWTKEEKYFELDEMEKAKNEFKDLYKTTFGPQAKQITGLH